MAKVRAGWSMGRFGSWPVAGLRGKDHFLWHFSYCSPQCPSFGSRMTGPVTRFRVSPHLHAQESLSLRQRSHQGIEIFRLPGSEKPVPGFECCRCHDIQSPEYMVRELYRCKSACGDEIGVSYCWFVHIMILTPVVRAEHFQGGRIVAGVRAFVQQAGVCKAQRCTADSSDKHPFIKQPACHLRAGTCAGSSQVSAPGSTSTSPWTGWISFMRTSGVRCSPPMVVMGARLLPQSTTEYLNAGSFSTFRSGARP